MRKITVVVLGLAFLTCGLVYVTGRAGQPQSPEMTKNGALNPDSIPDYVAYEFFFKSLVTAPTEGVKGQERSKAFALQSGVEAENIEVLLSDAQSVYQEISAFERRIKEIKDKTWPNPPAAVWTELKEIEREKEAAINRTVETLFSQRNAKMTSQLRDFVATQVKSKIKGFADKPNAGQHPRSHHGKIGTVLATIFGFSFLNFAQMQGDETVYIYANSYQSGEYVFGNGSVSATASSFGHEYSARTEMYGPCGQFETGSGSNVASLYYNGGWCDGEFSFYCVAVQACPIANTSHDAGQNQDNTSVNPYFILGEFDSAFSPSSVSTVTANAGVINITVSASQNMLSGKTVAITFGAQSVSGSANINIAGSGTLTGLTAGGSLAVPGTYDPQSLANGTTAYYRATALLSNASPGTSILPPPNKVSTAQLQINP